MKKRVAIQFFGHLRTFEKTYNDFYKNVIEPNIKNGYDIDIFMHNWDEIEYKAAQWHNEDFPELRGQKISQSQIDFIKNNYRPVKFELTPQLELNDDMLFPEFTGGQTKLSTMKNVYFSKYRVNQLRLKYEASHNVKYDLVLNTRADIVFETPFCFAEILEPYDTLLKDYETIDSKLFFAGTHRGMSVKEEMLLAASDIIYFSTPSVMNKISDIYNVLGNIEFISKNFRSWEHFLIFNARKNSIKPIQLGYSSQVDWRILRFKDCNVVQQSFPRKMISLIFKLKLFK